MSGAQTSTFYPVNQLLVDNAQQIQNQYAPQRNELFVQRARQEIGGTQLEHVSRAAAAVDALPLEQQPAAWQAGGEQLVKLGIIPSFQPYPGPERVKQIAGMGMSVENQFKLRGAQNTPDIYGVGGGGQPGTSGAATQAAPAPGGGGFTGDREKDRAIIVKQESGGDPTVLNYVARQDPTAYARGATASGKYQFVNSTWREGLQLAGLDPAQYPEARQAPEAVQDKVFDAVYGKYGTKPWEKGAKDWVRDEHGNYQIATVRPPAGSPGGAPAGTPPPYQVATTGAVPPPPGAAPGAVAPVAAPGAAGTAGAPPVVPVAAPAPAATPSAAMPPDLQTDANDLTAKDRQQLAPIFARVRAGQVSYETYQNEAQQRQAANVARQDKWQAQQKAAADTAYTREKDARAAALAEEEAQRKRDKAAREARLEAMTGPGGDALNNYDRRVLLSEDPEKWKSKEYAASYAKAATPTSEGGVQIYPDMTPFELPRDKDGKPILSYGQPRMVIGPGDVGKYRAVEEGFNTITYTLDTLQKAWQDASAADRAETLAGKPTALRTAWTNAALLAKGDGLFQLGVISGPDKQLLQGVLADPTTFWGAFTSTAEATKQIGMVKDLLSQRRAAAKNAYGGGMAIGGGGGGGAGGKTVLRFNANGDPIP
jgi:hypothetical protein